MAESSSREEREAGASPKGSMAEGETPEALTADEFFREEFLSFDRDKDGFITRSELLALLSVSYGNPTDDHVQDFLNEACADPNGLIGLDRFLEVMATKLTKDKAPDAPPENIAGQASPKETEALPVMSEALITEFLEAFSEADQVEVACITLDKLASVLRSLPQTLTESDVNYMIKAAGTDQNSTIDFPGFLDLIGHRLNVIVPVNVPVDGTERKGKQYLHSPVFSYEEVENFNTHINDAGHSPKKLITKYVTASDLAKNGRIQMSIRYASLVKDNTVLNMYDYQQLKWRRLVWQYTNKKLYLTNGWTEYAKENNVKAKDRFTLSSFRWQGQKFLVMNIDPMSSTAPLSHLQPQTKPLEADPPTPLQTSLSVVIDSITNVARGRYQVIVGQKFNGVYTSLLEARKALFVEVLNQAKTRKKQETKEPRRQDHIASVTKNAIGVIDSISNIAKGQYEVVAGQRFVRVYKSLHEARKGQFAEVLDLTKKEGNEPRERHQIDSGSKNTSNNMKFKMHAKVLTARKFVGGKTPRKQLATKKEGNEPRERHQIDSGSKSMSNHTKFKMDAKKLTARKSVGGKTPMKQLTTKPTRIVCLTNLADVNRIRNDYEALKLEMHDIGNSLGQIADVVIPQQSLLLGSVFWMYANQADAIKALEKYNGLKVDEKVVEAKYYDENKFAEGNYDD